MSNASYRITELNENGTQVLYTGDDVITEIGKLALLTDGLLVEQYKNGQWHNVTKEFEPYLNPKYNNDDNMEPITITNRGNR